MRTQISLVGLFSLISCGMIPKQAHATNMNLFAGSNLGRDESGMFVGELALPFLAEFGPFFEWSRNLKNVENRYIVGVVGRTTLPWLNFFADARAGFNLNTSPLNLTNGAGNYGFNFELGVGYRFTFSTIDLMPRLGIHPYSANSDIPLTDLSVGIAITLPGP